MSLQTTFDSVNRRVGIGRLTVGLAFLLMLAATAGKAWWGWPAWVQVILQAGFIGGFTDTVAIHMLFTRVWYLPGSGVLLSQRDAIIRSLADTMERHILNPTLIEERVRALSRDLDRRRLLDGINAVVDEVRPDLIAFVNAPEQRSGIAAAVRQQGGFWGDMADAIGVVTYDRIADRLCAGLTAQVLRFRVDDAMLDKATAYVGSIDEFLLKPDNPLVARHYGSGQSIVQLLFERLDAKQLVIDKLSDYDATQIRDIVSDNIREHMAWLEVFGVLLGMLVAALILILGAVLGSLGGR